MVINVNRGPFIYIPDTCRPGEYKMVKNPDWDGELPDIISFTEFLKWNYTLDYGRYIRESHEYGILPLPYGIPSNAKIKTVIITEGYYDRIDQFSFDMRVICEVYLVVNGYCVCQEYIVHGRYISGGGSNFLRGIEIYDGSNIKLKNPLDECLVPKMGKKKFRKIAKKILEEFYPFEITSPRRINVYTLAKAMGLDIRYANLSKNIKVKVRSKLIFDSRNITVYDEYGNEKIIAVTKPTIFVDESIKGKVEEYNAIVHECVHAYLHNLFYELQSHYRRMVNVKIPEFNDYNYSKTQRTSVKWMEVQANAIPRYIQMPPEQTEEVILDFFDRLVGEPDWEDYRHLIDHIKGKFGTARNATKRMAVELGWKEIRGVYVYNIAGYVEDYDVDYSFPEDHTYTLTLRHVSEIMEISEEFEELVNTGHFIYLDGHVVLNSDKYVERFNGHAMKLTEYARRHMSECCLDFKRDYENPDYEYTFGELHKDDLAPIEKRELSETELKRVLTVFNEVEDDNMKLCKTPTINAFAQAVQFHMERCGVTEDDVADRSGLGINTISNMRSGKKVRLESVLAFCVALELEEAFRTDLMEKADVKFSAKSKAHRFYQTILKLCPDANVFQYNQMCEAADVKPWTKERQQSKRYSKKKYNTAGSDVSVAS